VDQKWLHGFLLLPNGNFSPSQSSQTSSQATFFFGTDSSKSDEESKNSEDIGIDNDKRTREEDNFDSNPKKKAKFFDNTIYSDSSQTSQTF
jgi:hypothetical protein